MFEWLFKYPQNDFNAGALTFSSGLPVWLLWLLICIIAAVFSFSLWLQRGKLSTGKLSTIWVLQSTVAALLLLMVWQPSLDVKNLSSGENTIAVLLDRSASMDYEHKGKTRRAQALESLADIDADLKKNFTVNYGTIGDDLQWVDELATPGAAASTQSRIAEALINTLDQARGEPVTSIIVATDGSDNSDYINNASSPGFWEQLQSFNVPIHTVGVGREVIAEDTELLNVDLAAATLPGSVERATVTLRHGGGQSVRVKVYDGDSIIAIEDKELPDVAGDISFDIDIDAPSSGLRELRFEVEPDGTDKMPQNNSRKRLLQVAEQQRNILYFEGEPRWEYKFIRRAVNDANGLSLVSILRTTPNKFYRQGISDPQQHANGFPISKEELYVYDALIIGNVEAISLNASQHQLIHDFVSERGGTLMMLAGKNALADGAWYNSPVAKAIPVALPQSNTATFERIRAKVLLTQSGAQSPITRFDDDAQINATQWDELPELADFQRTGKPKPAATVLLGVELPDGSYPLLSKQRYGAGNAYVLASSGTWRWQMQMPSEDQRHEQFWRQLLQSMANSAPQRFEVTTDRQIYMDKSEVTISATLLDADFNPSVSEAINATLTSPDGSATTVTLSPDTSNAGAYSTTVQAGATGSWRVDVEPQPPSQTEQPEQPAESQTQTGEPEPQLEQQPAAPGELQAATRWIHRDDGSAENFHLAQNAAWLKRIAASTGGTYRTIDTIANLPEDIRASRNGIVQLQTLPLWNMPLFFLLILGLKIIEWMLRLLWGRL